MAASECLRSVSRALWMILPLSFQLFGCGVFTALKSPKEACAAGRAYSCIEAAEDVAGRGRRTWFKTSWQTAYPGRPVPKEIIALYRKGCDLKNDIACRRLEALLAEVERQELAHGSPATSSTATATRRDSCEGLKVAECAKCKAREVEACRELAKRFEVGDGVNQSWKHAAEYHRAACDLGNVQSCAKAAWLLFEGTRMAPNKKLARDLYVKACDGGSLPACANLAHDLEERGRHGEATKLYRKACEPDEFVPRACNALGNMYRMGRGVERDLARAVEVLEKACKAGLNAACANLAGAQAALAKADGEDAAKEEPLPAPTHGPVNKPSPKPHPGQRCGAGKTWCGDSSQGTCCAGYQVCCKRPGGNPFCGSGTRPCE